MSHRNQLDEIRTALATIAETPDRIAYLEKSKACLMIGLTDSKAETIYSINCMLVSERQMLAVLAGR